MGSFRVVSVFALAVFIAIGTLPAALSAQWLDRGPVAQNSAIKALPIIPSDTANPATLRLHARTAIQERIEDEWQRPWWLWPVAGAAVGAWFSPIMFIGSENSGYERKHEWQIRTFGAGVGFIAGLGIETTLRALGR